MTELELQSHVGLVMSTPIKRRAKLAEGARPPMIPPPRNQLACPLYLPLSLASTGQFEKSGIAGPIVRGPYFD